MANRDQAKKLREQQASQSKKRTDDALANQGENKALSGKIEKLQDDLANTKLLLEDEKKAKEELATEVEGLQVDNEELKAQLAKKDEEIETLKAVNEAQVAEQKK